MRPAPDPVIASSVAGRATSTLFLTAVTEAELRFGLAVMSPGKRRNGLASGLERMLETGFANRVLPFDSGSARLCRDRRRTAPTGPADRASRLPDRGDCSDARHGGGSAHHSGLRGHGNRHIQPMGRRLSETTAPRDSLAGSSRRCSRSTGASSSAMRQSHWIDRLDALQELTDARDVPA